MAVASEGGRAASKLYAAARTRCIAARGRLPQRSRREFLHIRLAAMRLRRSNWPSRERAAPRAKHGVGRGRTRPDTTVPLLKRFTAMRVRCVKKYRREWRASDSSLTAPIHVQRSHPTAIRVNFATIIRRTFPRDPWLAIVAYRPQQIRKRASQGARGRRNARVGRLFFR